MATRIGQCAAALLLAVTAIATGPSASAAALLQLDVNSASVQSHLVTGANGFGGLTHTGTLVFTADATCDLSDALYDGISQSPTHVPVTVTGSINLVGGLVAAGSNVSLQFLNSPNPDNTLSFPLLIGGGDLQTQTGGFFKLIADMGTATFANSNPVGGVGIVPWMTTNNGSFTLQHFAPDGSGFSNDVNLEVLVPEPATVGLLSLAGISLVGRRSRK